MGANQVLLFSLLLVVDSMHYIFARLLLPRIPPTASAMYVLAIATVEVFVFAAVTGRLRLRAFRAHAWFYVAIGFLVAAATALSYESMAFVDPGTASLLGKTTTLFSVFFGILWLNERLTRRQLVGTLVALVGATIIVFQPGDFMRFGALIVLLSSFLYALHTALVKRYGESITFLDFFVFRLLTTTGFLLLMVGGRGVWVIPDGMTWLLLAVTATIDVVVSRTLYYQTLRKLPMSVHSIILTLSPVVSILLSLAIFGIRPTGQQLIGGAAVLLGVLLVTLRGRYPRAVTHIASAEAAEGDAAPDVAPEGDTSDDHPRPAAVVADSQGADAQTLAPAPAAAGGTHARAAHSAPAAPSRE